MFGQIKNLPECNARRLLLSIACKGAAQKRNMTLAGFAECIIVKDKDGTLKQWDINRWNKKFDADKGIITHEEMMAIENKLATFSLHDYRWYLENLHGSISDRQLSLLEET